MRLDGIGHRAIADHERDRARLMSAAPLFDELAGGAVRRLELAHDGPVAREDRRAAEQADRDATAQREADPISMLAWRIAAAEEDRNVAMMRWRPLAAWLAERTDVPGDDYVARDSARAPMSAYREEAAELQQSVASLSRRVSRLNGQLWALVSGKVAA